MKLLAVPFVRDTQCNKGDVSGNTQNIPPPRKLLRLSCFRKTKFNVNIMKEYSMITDFTHYPYDKKNKTSFQDI